MKKLRTLAFYALITPVAVLGAGSALAQQAAPAVTQGAQTTQPSARPDPQTAADRASTLGQPRMQRRGFLTATPANGIQATDFIGAKVRTTGGEDVGPVHDLIIDENGQILAIVIGVGGFLGMAEKGVAIGWDDATRSGPSDDYSLQINVTRDALRSAPEFKKQN